MDIDRAIKLALSLIILIGLWTKETRAKSCVLSFVDCAWKNTDVLTSKAWCNGKYHLNKKELQSFTSDCDICSSVKATCLNTAATVVRDIARGCQHTTGNIKFEVDVGNANDQSCKSAKTTSAAPMTLTGATSQSSPQSTQVMSTQTLTTQSRPTAMIRTSPTISSTKVGSVTTTLTTDPSSNTRKDVEQVHAGIVSLTEAVLTGNQLEPNEIVQRIDGIENDLASLAKKYDSTCNVSSNISKGIQISRSTFSLTVKPVSVGRDVDFAVGQTNVRIGVKEGPDSRIAFAAQLNLPNGTLSSLIGKNESQHNVSIDGVLETTKLFPGAPYLTASALPTRGGAPSLANVTYTFTVVDRKRLESTVLASALHSHARLTEIKPRCSFLDPALQELSQRGCQWVVSSDKRNVTCECNHTTLFAVLLTTKAIVVPDGVKKISYVAEAISITFLAFTLIVLLVLKKNLNSDRTGVQIALCLVLLLFHCFVLLQEVALINSRMCELVTVLTHYFLLASGSCMSLEAILLIMKTSRNSLQYAAKQKNTIRIMKHFISWILPGIIVTLATIIGFPTGSYMDETQAYKRFAVAANTTIPRYMNCWVGASYGMRVPAVILPLAVSWAFNMSVALKVTAFVVAKHREIPKYTTTAGSTKPSMAVGSEQLAQMLIAARALLLLVPVFGVTWIFAFLAGTPDKLASKVFMYLNAIFNGLQGFFLFLVYCVINRQARDLLVKKTGSIKS